VDAIEVDFRYFALVGGRRGLEVGSVRHCTGSVRGRQELFREGADTAEFTIEQESCIDTSRRIFNIP
jgi:hypothetical protein